MDQTGDQEIRQKIFKHVKELSPNTLFFLNDYGIVMNYGGRFQIFQEQIRELLAAGAPIDAIGLQSHIKVRNYQCFCQPCLHLTVGFWC